MNDRDTKRTKLAMYANQLIGSLGSGLASPFIPYYAAYLSFNSEEMGFVQAVSNFFPNAFQYLWGKLSDLIRRRIIFVVIGGIVSYLMFSAFIVTHTFYYFLLALSVQAIFSAMVPPAWNALIGEVSSLNKRGIFIANLSFYSNLASLISLIFFTVYAFKNLNLNIIIFYYSFYTASVLGTISALVMLYATEPQKDKKSDGNAGSKISKKFFSFVVAVSVYNFFMSLAWPLFYITTVDVVKANVFEVGVINLISVAFTILLLRYFGKLSDKIGSKRFMIMSRIIFAPVPLLYGISTNVYELYVINAVTGIGTAMTNVSFTSYLIENTTLENRGRATGIYSAAIGTVTFFGSILGGFSAQIMEGYLPLVTSLLIVYIVSTMGRSGSVSLFLKLDKTIAEKI